MTHFYCEDLIDSIRHGFSIEDDTGVSTKILGKAARRCKPGGIPLTFSVQTDSSDEEHSPPFEILQTTQPTSVLCQQNIWKKTKDVHNLIQARRNEKPKLNQRQVDHFFQPRNVPTEPVQKPTSLLSRQIEEGQSDKPVEKFEEYARFEAFENEPNSKLIHVVFPFADKPPGSSSNQTIAVRAKNNASMDEFVGLCCFLYTRAEFTPKCSEPQRYSIYMTDDTNDVDTELPPIDKSRTVRECGFGLLALVEKPERVARVNGYVVTVYTVSGHKFVFELNTLAKSLGWLRDEALKKRREVSDTRSSNMRQTVYELQTLESDEPLNLFKTISSTGVLEFLMIRKNSSRSNFNPLALDASNDTGPRSPLFIQTKQRPTLAPYTSSSSPKPLNNNIDSPTTSIRSGFAPPITPLGCGNLIQEYFVDRIHHRLKPKCPSKLSIRDDCLEITPVQVEKKRAFVPQAPQKYVNITWELIGGIDSSDRHGSRRVTRIWWLPISSELFEMTEKFIKQLNQTSKRINENFYHDAPKPLNASSTHRGSSVHFVNHETDAISSSPSKTAHSARPSLNEGPFNSTSSGDNSSLSSFNPSQILRSYENLNWKFISIDAPDDESWQFGLKIIEIIDSKNSIIRQLFQHSGGGSRRPRLAAEELLNRKGTYVLSPNEPKRQSAAITSSASVGNFKIHKKRKSINPVPLFNRMLSKQE